MWRELIERVAGNDREVKEVELEGERIGNEEACELVEALKRNVFVARVSLAYTGLGDESACRFAEMLELNESITKLDLRYNDLSPLVVFRFRKSLRKNFRVVEIKFEEKVKVGGIHVSNCPAVKVASRAVKRLLEENARFLKAITGQCKSVKLTQRKLKIIPKEVFSLPHLQVLDLSQNDLCTLPAEIGLLTSLKELDLHHNQLQCLPAELTKLQQLAVLSLQHNNLNSFPTGFPDKKQTFTLTSIDVRNNLFSRFDKYFISRLQLCSKLSNFRISGNPLLEELIIPRELLQKPNEPQLLDFIRSLQRSDFPSSTRLLFMGDNGSTTEKVIRCLQENATVRLCTLPRSNRLEGVQEKIWSVELDGSHKINHQGIENQNINNERNSAERIEFHCISFDLGQKKPNLIKQGSTYFTPRLRLTSEPKILEMNASQYWQLLLISRHTLTTLVFSLKRLLKLGFHNAYHRLYFYVHLVSHYHSIAYPKVSLLPTFVVLKHRDSKEEETLYNYLWNQISIQYEDKVIFCRVSGNQDAYSDLKCRIIEEAKKIEAFREHHPSLITVANLTEKLCSLSPMVFSSDYFQEHCKKLGITTDQEMTTFSCAIEDELLLWTGKDITFSPFWLAQQFTLISNNLSSNGCITQEQLYQLSGCNQDLTRKLIDVLQKFLFVYRIESNNLMENASSFFFPILLPTLEGLSTGSSNLEIPTWWKLLSCPFVGEQTVSDSRNNGFTFGRLYQFSSLPIHLMHRIVARIVANTSQLNQFHVKCWADALLLQMITPDAGATYEGGALIQQFVDRGAIEVIVSGVKSKHLFALVLEIIEAEVSHLSCNIKVEIFVPCFRCLAMRTPRSQLHYFIFQECVEQVKKGQFYCFCQSKNRKHSRSFDRNTPRLVETLSKSDLFQNNNRNELSRITSIAHALSRFKDNISLRRQNSFPIRIDFLAPDIALAGIEELIVPNESVEIKEQIGSGGFGTVHKAVFNHEVVAAKFITIETTEESNFEGQDKDTRFKDFCREVMLMSGINHPNIVGLKAITLFPQFAMLVEYCGGGDLQNYLANAKKSGSAPSLPFVLKIATDISRGMEFLHSATPAIIHRDLKSPNILLTMNEQMWNELLVDNELPNDSNMGTQERRVVAKVSDFGLSLHFSLGSRRVVDNPLWLAPEILGGGSATEKSDVYSYGIIVWELFSLEVPFSEFNESFLTVLERKIIQGLRPTIPLTCPLEMKQLIERCWHQQPQKRPNFSEIDV